MSGTVFRIEIQPRHGDDKSAAALLREAGADGVERVRLSRLFFVEGGLTREQALRIGEQVLADPVTERTVVLAAGDASALPQPTNGTPAPARRARNGTVDFEIHLRPGVMDPTSLSTLAELRAEGYDVSAVRTARRYVVEGATDPRELLAAVRRVLANDCIEQVIPGTAGIQPAPRPPLLEFRLRHVPLRELDDGALERLSRDGHLFLSLGEMKAVQAHFRELGREPTDLELETIAQTWSEHCVHKTLKSAIVYRGEPMPGRRHEGTEARRHEGEGGERSTDREIERSRAPAADQSKIQNPKSKTAETELRYDNLLRDTIARATRELMEAGRGPECLSVFKDNAGVIGFDDKYGVAFKVETHNHPSAIEPYGGAATGVGGCIRDVIGCGLGARPIANTDVFCVAPGDWPFDELPRGVLHPARVLRGVVQGVADYGNRIGIPTVNGAVYFDPRYLGNPLVYCGCIGLIPRDRIEERANPGDLIVLIGGRTGRDGIHGATFSSAELTDSHADEFSHAVQIGNAITEKRFLDAIVQARDADGGCLYSAITDCGAGGLSSAVGEMGEQVGAAVDLENVPLKYAGLRYDEIWISEAQERMVLAVPPENLERFMAIMQAEEVEATVIGAFGAGEPGGAARLVVRYDGTMVSELDMAFLHNGLPMGERQAEWTRGEIERSRDRESQTGDRGPIQNPESKTQNRTPVGNAADWPSRLLRELSRPAAASKAWIIRKYDHEVQGGSVIKPLCGPRGGPADAAVLRPRLDSDRGIAVACGLAPHLSDVDPYWMALAAMDEAIRNIVCVGGDPSQTAVLDNFCWGRTDDPRQLGGLVRACQACYDGAMAYGTPFISGKDSLNNEFALDERDVQPLLATLREMAAREDAASARLAHSLEAIERRIRETGRLSIPGTLLISAVGIVRDVNVCVTPDLKRPGNALYLVGGLPIDGFDISFSLEQAARTHQAVAAAIGAGVVRSCHDVSDGGWLAALAEMCLSANRGAALSVGPQEAPPPFAECAAGYVVEAADSGRLEQQLAEADVTMMRLGVVAEDDRLRFAGGSLPAGELHDAWSGRMQSKRGSA